MDGAIVAGDDLVHAVLAAAGAEVDCFAGAGDWEDLAGDLALAGEEVGGAAFFDWFKDLLLLTDWFDIVSNRRRGRDDPFCIYY